MRRLNVLLSTLGSAGDIHPFVAIGRALLARGHSATLVTSAHFRDLVFEAGIGFVGIGTPEDYTSVVDDPDLWDPRRAFRVFARRVVIPAVRPVYEALSTNLRPDTVIVAQGQAFGAHLVFEKHRVPFVTVNLQPAAFRTAYDSPLFPRWLPIITRPFVNRIIDFLVLDRELANPINSFRAQLGLAPVKRIIGTWAHSPQTTIGLFPEWFAPSQPDWPANTMLSGFILPSQDSGPPLSGLAEFLDTGTPPVIFTPGTEMKHAHDFFAISVLALTRLHRRGILLTRHADHLPSSLPEGVISFPYIPFDTILPRAAAIVHHGGIGTIAQAFAAGIPQLIRPMAHDQPDNAARVQRLGVGITIAPKQYTPERVQLSLKRLLTSQTVAETCQQYSSKMAAAEALSAVCAEIEEVARTHAVGDTWKWDRKGWERK